MADQPGRGEQRPTLQPGQTLIFLGDHTSPDDAGYVRIMQSVLDRFHPTLRVNLISAGAPGQTAAALQSRELMQIITSSKPDWLVIGIGLGDAMLEPAARRLLNEYRRQQQAQQEADDADTTFGPEVRTQRNSPGPVADIGREPDPDLPGLDPFKSRLAATIDELQEAGVRPLLMTTIVVGNDLQNPVNGVLRLYNRGIREAAKSGVPVSDIEKAFRNVFDRAGNYKQKVALTGPTGSLNAQGQALVARILLDTLGALPYPGYRPLR